MAAKDPLKEIAKHLVRLGKKAKKSVDVAIENKEEILDKMKSHGKQDFDSTVQAASSTFEVFRRKGKDYFDDAEQRADALVEYYRRQDEEDIKAMKEKLALIRRIRPKHFLLIAEGIFEGTREYIRGWALFFGNPEEEKRVEEEEYRTRMKRVNELELLDQTIEKMKLEQKANEDWEREMREKYHIFSETFQFLFFFLSFSCLLKKKKGEKSLNHFIMYL